MPLRLLLAVTVLLPVVLCPSGVAAASLSPRIAEISGTIAPGEAWVRFTLEDAFTPEMVEALNSGIEISFRTTVRVERVYRNWFDMTVGELRYTRSVRYDALANVYRLRGDGGEELLPGVREALERMTHFEVRVPVPREIERGKPYRAYVRARLDRVGLSEPLRSIFFFSSLWDVETGWSHGTLQAR